MSRTCHGQALLYFLSFFGIYFLQIGCPQTIEPVIQGNDLEQYYKIQSKSITGPKTLRHSPKTYSEVIHIWHHREREKTHSHLFNSELEVLTERISGAPASVTLKSISLIPFHNSQAGVISDGSHFKVVLRVSTKLKNDSEKDFPNVVILKLNLLKIY